MPRRPFFRRDRLPLVAVAASLALHAAIIVGVPGRAPVDEPEAAVYSAVLESPPPAEAAPAPRAAPPRPAARPRPKARAPLPLPSWDAIASSMEPAGEAPELPPLAEMPELAPLPEKVALAQPVATPEPPKETFPTQALPGNIKITYELTSSFADGRAVYEWEREGDQYVISGEAEAVGFFTLFLEGRIRQESRGTVTADGLRPERFVEQRPNSAAEGLEFDWAHRKVTFDKGDQKTTSDLSDNTVDWLSMIFQLAHRPPQAQSFEMRVYTQKRMYQFRLKVLGEEEIEIPIGKVRALHLRHEDEAKNENVDVWLGVDHYYVPVKMRYPVARNRVTVEQTATNIRVR